MFPRYGVHPGASPTVCFAAPPLDVCGCAARRYAPDPRMNTYARPAEGAKDQKPNQDQEPLTLALSQRERELIEVFGRGTPTCDTTLNSGREKPTNRPPLPLGEGWGEGREHHKNQSQARRALHHSIGRVSARLLLILIHGRRRKAEWRDRSRSEGPPSPSERAARRSKPFWLLFSGPAFRASGKSDPP